MLVVAPFPDGFYVTAVAAGRVGTWRTPAPAPTSYQEAATVLTELIAGSRADVV